jgi:hypothetical protein
MDEHEFREKVLEDLAILKTCAKQTDKDIVSLNKTVYGNGTPGIKTQVFVLWGILMILGSLVIRALAK